MASKRKSAEPAQRAPQPGSMTDQLVKLEIGDTVSRVREIKFTRVNDRTTLSEAKRALVSIATPQIARVNERYPDRSYEIESTVFATGFTVYAVVLIKRVK